jgi:hypothetical protein
MHAQAEELDVAPSVMDQVLHGCQRLTAEEIEAKVRKGIAIRCSSMCFTKAVFFY